MNPGIGRMLANEREQDLRRRVQAAGPSLVARADHSQGPRRLRLHPVRRLGTWAGLVMVRAGQRLAGVEVLPVHGPQLQRPA